MRCGPTEGIYLLHDLAPCNNSKNTRTFLENKKNTCPEMAMVFARHYSHRGRLEYNKERH